MKKLIAIIAVLVLSLALLTACGAKAPELVGTWQADWMGTTLEISFDGNGTYTTRQKTGDEWETVGSGEYIQDGTKLTWNGTAVSISSQKSDNVEYLTIGYSGPEDGQAYTITYKRIR